MPPFFIEFHCSPIRRALVVCFTGVLLLVVLLYFSGCLKIVLLLCWLCTAVYAWHEPLEVVGLSVNAQGDAQLRCGSEDREAQLLPDSLIHPYLCCLKWRLACGRVLWQWVWYDSAGREDLRRLRIWAKFGLPEPQGD